MNLQVNLVCVQEKVTARKIMGLKPQQMKFQNDISVNAHTEINNKLYIITNVSQYSIK